MGQYYSGDPCPASKILEGAPPGLLPHLRCPAPAFIHNNLCPQLFTFDLFCIPDFETFTINTSYLHYAAILLTYPLSLAAQTCHGEPAPRQQSHEYPQNVPR